MPLNWNIERCDNWKELIEDSEWGVTNALIWTTMVVGLHEISEANANEFFARVDAVQRGTGELCYKDTGTPENTDSSKWLPYFITYEDIVRRIGLGTNASRMTKTEFLKHMGKISKLDSDQIKALYYSALSQAKEKGGKVNA